MPVATTKRTVVPLATAKKGAAPAPTPKLATAKAAPKPAAPVKAAAPKADRAPRQRGINVELAGRKLTNVVPNPKREGTKCHAMFELYKKGMTYEALREAGVTVADIHWNLKHEYIAFA